MDEQDLASAPAELTSMAHVRLPGFWRQAPRQWFTHAEAMFHNSRIRSNLTRVNYVLAALDADGISAVSDLLGVNASYDTIRARLVSTYAVPQAARFQSIVQPGGMGDRSPSQLLRAMRDVYPDDMGDSALEQFWRQKLPATVRTVIAGFSGTLDQLAERADRIAEASSHSELSAVQSVQRPRTAAVFPPHNEPAQKQPSQLPPVHTTQTTTETRVQALETAVLTLSTQVTQLLGLNATRTRAPTSRAPQAESTTRVSEDTTGWCFYHVRYGRDARKCRDPCTFSPTQKN